MYLIDLNRMENILIKILFIFCYFTVIRCIESNNTNVFVNETTTQYNYEIIRKCLNKVPEAATKCTKQYDEHMQFIQHSLAIEERNEKHKMFCCALWDWRHCVKQLAHQKCSYQSIFAIDQLVPFTVNNRTDTRSICSNFTSNNHNCTSVSNWIVIVFIIVLLILIFGVYYVFKRDKHNPVLSSIRLRDTTITESDEQNYEFIDENMNTHKDNHL